MVSSEICNRCGKKSKDCFYIRQVFTDENIAGGGLVLEFPYLGTDADNNEARYVSIMITFMSWT
jgi:hypothetical protein